MKTIDYLAGRCGWAAGVGAFGLWLLAAPTVLNGQEPEPAAEAVPESESAAEAAPEELTEFAQRVSKIAWKTEGKGRIGGSGEIVIPEGYRFADGTGASELLQAWGNPPSPNELGVICNDAVEWGIFFQFDSSGYVKDDEKDELDPEKLLKQKSEAQNEYNKQLAESGLEAWTVVGWAKEPFYNEETHNLEWGLILESEGGARSVNYISKILGREGVMDAVLVCSADAMESIMPTYRSLLEGYAYQEGKAYADYKSGDKVSKVGLTALIVGGSAVAAAKLGLFAVIAKFFGKAWKLLVVGIIAIGAVFKKIFSRGSGRLEES